MIKKKKGLIPPVIFCEHGKFKKLISPLMISANVIIYEYLCPSIHHWWDYRCLNVTKLCVHHVTHGDYCGFVNFSLSMGSLGRLTSSSCSVKSAWPGALPHLASPPSIYAAKLPPSGEGSGPCERLPGPQRMSSSKWEHVECICFDLSRLKFTKNWFLVLSPTPSLQ